MEHIVNMSRPETDGTFTLVTFDDEDGAFRAYKTQMVLDTDEISDLVAVIDEKDMADVAMCVESILKSGNEGGGPRLYQDRCR